MVPTWSHISLRGFPPNGFIPHTDLSGNDVGERRMQRVVFGDPDVDGDVVLGALCFGGPGGGSSCMACKRERYIAREA